MIVNKFNHLFTYIGNKLIKQIIAPKNKDFEQFLNKSYNVNFRFHNINEESVCEIIDKLSPKASFGFDGLSFKLIKNMKYILIKPLTIIINQMLNTGIFPDKLKIAKIVPVYKMMMNIYSTIASLSLCYLLSQKYLKKLFLTNYITFVENKIV